MLVQYFDKIGKKTVISVSYRTIPLPWLKKEQMFCKFRHRLHTYRSARTGLSHIQASAIRPGIENGAMFLQQLQSQPLSRHEMKGHRWICNNHRRQVQTGSLLVVTTHTCVLFLDASAADSDGRATTKNLITPVLFQILRRAVPHQRQKCQKKQFLMIPVPICSHLHGVMF